MFSLSSPGDNRSSGHRPDAHPNLYETTALKGAQGTQDTNSWVTSSAAHFGLLSSF
jgi:hypothetical protein